MATSAVNSDSSTVELVDQLLAARDRERAGSAMDFLGMDARGWPNVAYHEESMAIWSENLEVASRDVATMHHLAIAHHARAIDLEAHEAGRSADEDWVRAHQLWFALWQSDEFWELIASRSSKDAHQMVGDIRQEFPTRFLRFHYDIALDRSLPVHRRQQHVRLAEGTPFPREAFEAAREEALQDWVAQLADEVWHSEDIDELWSAIEHIEGFLHVDPHYAKAAEEALQVLIRWAKLQVQAQNAADGSDASGCRAVVHAAKKWNGYLGPLIEGQVLDPSVKQRLGAWYNICAQSFMLLEQWDKARECARIYGQFDPQDAHELLDRIGQARTHKLIGDATAAMKADDFRRGRRLLDEAIQIHPSSAAHFLRCQCRIALRDLPAARQDLRDATRLGGVPAHLLTELDDMLSGRA